MRDAVHGLMGTIRRLGRVALAVMLAAGCAGTSTPGVAVVPTSSTPTAIAAPCTESAVRLVIEAFIDAFNQGDDPARFFAPAASGPRAQAEQFAARAFNWYSLSDGRSPNVLITDRSGLAAYFAQRHQAGERWVLDLVNYYPAEQTYPRADFGFGLIRMANDIASPKETRRENAKGTVNCDTKKIVTWTQ